MPVISTGSTSRSDCAYGAGKALIFGVLYAFFAEACCVGILVLIMLGISGAWIGSLTLLEPYQPLFAGVASKALILAALRIWCSVAACDSGLFCQRTNVNRLKKD